MPLHCESPDEGDANSRVRALSPQMTSDQPPSQPDIWSDWLLHLRHADDPAFERAIRSEIATFADRILDGARLESGMTLADVGAGDGLMAFRAIDRVGPALRVLLTDISAPLLKHAESLALQRGVRNQCSFHHCTAENLHGIGSASVDVVVTRSVLAYVADKIGALREFHRILRAGGRISIAEPIMRDEALAVCALRKEAIEAHGTGEKDRFLKLMHRWKAAQYPDTPEKISTSPIANYTERDLVSFARAAGFGGIHLEFHIDETPAYGIPWAVSLGSSPHPWAPPLSAILAEQFTPEERLFFEPILRALVESSKAGVISRIAYLTAEKPRT